MVAYDATEGAPETWLEREYREGDAVFSPDGRYVAYVSYQTGVEEVYIRPFPGPGGQITASVRGGREPTWAPNGELFYRRPGDWMMMVVEVSTDPVLSVGPPRELFAGRVSADTRAWYTVSADGQRFLMSADQLASHEPSVGAGNPKVVVVQNWVEELKERVPVN